MYKSIFISDVHLGSSLNKNRENLFDLLEHIEAERLFLVGDIINSGSSANHPDIIKFITILQSKPWEIIYITGNNEEDRTLPPVSIDFNKNLFSQEKYIYQHNVYLEHGHSFHYGSNFFLIIKRFIKYFRLKSNNKKRSSKRELQKINLYYHIIKPLAQKLLIGSFKSYMISLAKENSCTIVICGHFHIPEDKTIKGIRYLNCGDWVNNSSFVIEDKNGNFFLKKSFKKFK
jgi:UDP-2,3-diacylglucosamine pyrophosphatase LpxH